MPGFIDCHFHILGGGGEGGFQNRTPEVKLSQLTSAGVTTVVGCLGTDGVGRDMTALISKARGLEAEGITTYLYDGSYRLPLTPVTDSIIQDFLTIDKIIGIGEIAVSDHRSSQPSFEEFTRAVADARVGGMLSGKAGIVNVHLGGGKKNMSCFYEPSKRQRFQSANFYRHMPIGPASFSKQVLLLQKWVERSILRRVKILISGKKKTMRFASVKD